MKIAIAGAGLAGLSLGYNLENKRIKFDIFEKDSRVGGLLKTEERDGFLFDRGGSHIIFSKNDEILRELVNIAGPVVMHRRRTVIRYRDSWIKYPFENGIFALPPEERYEILLDFVNNLSREKKRPETLREFFLQLFGEKIVDKYIGPYNEKIWKRSLNELAMAWSEDRIPQPPVEDVLRAAVGIETEGYLHQLRFFYPLHGGIETLARNIYGLIKERVNLSTDIRKIKYHEEGIDVNGSFYRLLVSSIPLPELAKIDGVNTGDLAKKLDYNSVTVVGLGVRGKLPDFHWAYIPDKDIIFHRLAFLNNYSPNMAPPNKATIIAEISHRPEEEPKDAIDETILGLERIGIHVEVETAEKWVNKYAYVITNKEYFKYVPKLRRKLKEMHIFTLGRHGNWEYLNMDAVWERAKNMAHTLERLE